MSATISRRTRSLFHLLSPLCQCLSQGVRSPSLTTHETLLPKPQAIHTQQPKEQLGLDLSTPISRLLSKGGSWDSLRTSFGSVELTHSLVERVFLNLKEPVDAQKALTFFHWSSRHRRFQHGLRSYCLLVHVLVHAGLLIDARALLESAIQKNSESGSSDSSSAAEVLLSTYEAVLPGRRVFDLLVQTYAKLRMTEQAFDACRRLGDHGFLPSLISFNTMLNVAQKSGEDILAWKVFEYMIEKRVYPNQITVETIINVMRKEGTLRRMVDVLERIHGKRCAPGVIVYVTLVFRIFEEDRTEEGIMLLKRMLQKNMVSDVAVYSLRIFAHCNMGRSDLAFETRDEMINRGCSLNAFVYTSFIGAHCKEGRIEDANRFMQEMLSIGLMPYDETYNHLIVGCSRMGRLDECLGYYEQLLKGGFLPSCETCNEMLGRLCEAGEVEKANAILSVLLDKGFNPNEVTYLKLIDGYGEIGNAQAILQLHYEMKHRGLDPGELVYTSLVRNLCHCGKLKEAEKFLTLLGGKSLAPYLDHARCGHHR